METETVQPALAGQVERGVRPRAWIGHMVTTRKQFAALDDEPRSALCAPWTPLYALASGWRFTRDEMNRIVVKMPDGSGCVVENVANDPRLVPEEVLFALCKALGA